MSRYPGLLSDHLSQPQQPYRDEQDTRQLPARPVSTELQDYWDDGPIPPPHRLSNNPSPFSSTENLPNQYNNNNPNTTNLNNPFASNLGHPTASSAEMNNLASRGGYGNLEDPNPIRSESPWLQQQNSKSKRSKFLTIGGLILIGVLIVVGVVVGVVVSKHKSSSSSSSSSAAGSATGSGTPSPSTGFFGVVQQTSSQDPSTFVRDSALSNAFYGFAYTPFGSQLPECGSNLPAVIEDIQLISQITSRIRLYGADCNQASLVLEAIQKTKVNLTVFLGNYVVPNDDTSYDRQRDEINTAITTYGVDNVAGITVGNEYILNYVTANGGGNMDPNSAIANQGAAYLVAKIADTRSSIQSLKLSKTLQVGTSDAGAFFNNEVLAVVDYGMANVHPWFANQSIDAAASWTTGFFQSTDIAQAANVSNNPQMYIAETGWPTQSNDLGNESNGVSTASVANLQKYLDTFVCSSNTAPINYFYFEVFDEPWKNATFGGVEGYWGIFNFNKTLKAGLTLPTCSHS